MKEVTFHVRSILFLAKFPPAERPKNSVLESEKIERTLGVSMRPWEEELQAIFELQQQLMLDKINQSLQKPAKLSCIYTIQCLMILAFKRNQMTAL